MSSKPCIDNPNYVELDALINSKLAEANEKLTAMGFTRAITRESLLTGEINTHKESGARCHLHQCGPDCGALVRRT